jgi:hypothetical protein
LLRNNASLLANALGMNIIPSQLLLTKPVIDFTSLDHRFEKDTYEYLYTLINLQQEIKDLMAATLFSKEIDEKISRFLDYHSSILSIMNLQSISNLLILIKDAEHNGYDSRCIEELYSQLYFQIYHVLEAIKDKIKVNKV